MKIGTSTLVTIFGIVVVTVIAANGQSRRLPVYEVLRSATSIRVDGRLTESFWAKVSGVSLVNNLDGSPGTYQTEAKVLYDDNFLYVAFRSADSNIWATYKQRDRHLWDEEVVEVFVQADPEQSNYLEFEVNPLGTMLDIYLLDIRKPLHYQSWNSEKLKWGVHVNGTVDGKSGDLEWTCEIAIPMEDIVMASHLPPRAGDRWRMNLYRMEQKPVPALLAWSPTFKDDFHLPDKFGEIVFTDRPAK